MSCRNRRKKIDVEAIVCVKVADARLVTSGSTVATCATCDAEVWISPETLRAARGPLICVDCLRQKYRSGETIELVGIQGGD